MAYSKIYIYGIYKFSDGCLEGGIFVHILPSPPQTKIINSYIYTYMNGLGWERYEYIHIYIYLSHPLTEYL